MNLKGDIDTNCNWCSLKDPQKIGNGTEKFINHRTSGDHPDYNIFKIDQNTEKSPGDLMRLVAPQSSVKNHHLTLVWKISPRSKIIIKVKMKESKKIDEYLDLALAEELKKLWNVKVTLIPIGVGNLETVSEKETGE